MSQNKNHHFVPQFYLREFSVSENRKQIGVFNIETEVFVQAGNIKFQASKKNYYGKDSKLEKELARIEGFIATSLAEIIKAKDLPRRNTDSHFNLLAFVVLSFLRTTVNENTLNESTDQMIKKIYGKDPNFKDEIDDWYFGFQNSSVFGVTLMADILPASLDLNYKLLINDTSKPFITSDNPVVKYNLLLEQKNIRGGIVGLGTIGLKIFLPLTPKLMVLFYDADSYSVGVVGSSTFLLKQESAVNDLNMLQILNCEKIVFFNHQCTETYIRHLNTKSKPFERANRSIVSEHRLIDKFGNDLPESILHSRTTECRVGLQLPFIKISAKGRKYKPTTMAHIRPFIKKLIDAGSLQ